MSAKINCTIHGSNEETFVCTHILGSLKDGVKRGFVPVIDDEGGYQALCSTCDAMSDEAWSVERDRVISMICLACFRSAAELNGVGAAQLEALRA